jgi:predicted dehydrogenase
VTAAERRYAPALRLDLVGCGAAMERVHVPVIKFLSESDRLAVRGCFDLDPDNAQRVAEMTSATTVGPPAPVRPDTPVDAALIATPPEAHTEQAHRYLSAAKHVFIEKPVTTRSAELAQLIELSNRVGRRVIVDHFRRFYPSVQIARRLVRDGVLGRVDRVEVSEGSRWSWATRSNYDVEAAYGGVAYDTGSHILDMALFILSLDDEPDSDFTLTAVEKIPNREPAQSCEFALEVLSPARGKIGLGVAVSRLGPLAKGVKIWGENGMLFVPAEFATGPLLRTSEERLVITKSGQSAFPGSAWHGYLQAHRELAASVRDPDRESVLDAPRFMLLTRILEEVWEAAPTE